MSEHVPHHRARTPHDTPESHPGRRPFGVQLLAALLTFYAMCGVFIAATLVNGRPPEIRWELVASAAAVFGLTSGLAARTVWALRPTAPRWLLTCAAAGAALCITLPSAVRSPAAPEGDMWTTAIIAAILFVAFLSLAARYVRRQVGSPP